MTDAEPAVEPTRQIQEVIDIYEHDARRTAKDTLYDAIRRELNDDDLRAADAPIIEDPAGLEEIWRRAGHVVPEQSPAAAIGEWIARLLLLRDELPPPGKLDQSEINIDFGETRIVISL